MPNAKPPFSDAKGGNSSPVVALPGARTSQLPLDNNLPPELSSFIGRGREMAEVKRLLKNTRLLTLTGPGGCGKTRVALRVAYGLVEEREDRVWLVELASLSEPNLLPQAVGSALVVHEVPGRSLTEMLVEHLKLKEKKTLLVLDNCEHLVEGCAALANTLLCSRPDLKILATSCEPMSIVGEGSWLVPSLSSPDLLHLLPIEVMVWGHCRSSSTLVGTWHRKRR